MTKRNSLTQIKGLIAMSHIKRNTVVSEKNTSGFTPYGRVWRQIDKNHVEVIFCTKDFGVYHIDELEIHDYKGR